MNLIRVRSVLVLFSIVLSSHFAMAQLSTPPRQLTVIADHGGVSALSYYESLGLAAVGPESNSTQEPSAPVSSSGRPVSMSASHRKGLESATQLITFTPVHSSRLTPGPVSRRVATSSTPQAAMQPFFIIGDDPLSRRWLRERYAVLKQLNAAGLVVNVDSQEAMQALQRLVPDLMLSAVPGDDLADKLHLDHYPVLVTAAGIEQ